MQSSLAMYVLSMFISLLRTKYLNETHARHYFSYSLTVKQATSVSLKELKLKTSIQAETLYADRNINIIYQEKFLIFVFESLKKNRNH